MRTAIRSQKEMKTDGQQSDNIEDRRGERGGGGIGLPIGGRGIGLGTIVVALVASYFLGIDPGMVMSILGGNESPVVQQQAPAQGSGRTAGKPTDEEGRFMSEVLASTEAAWSEIFKEGGAVYHPPKLVLFSGATQTACGTGQTAAGPFYCPGDQKVYLDTSFFTLMRQRFQAAGDFAQAYVVAHEVGHHVQNQLGVMAKTDRMRRQMSEREYNQVSVRVELQADCFAGVWANKARKLNKLQLEPGDIEEALNAANKIGDDALQRKSQGYVVPDSFTHGSSAQRVRWFRTGFDTGNLKACDTFNATQL
jgi:predicted metalloprotease